MREPFSCVFVAVRAMLFAVAGSRFACKNAVLDGPIARSQNCLFSERGRLYSLDKKNDTVAEENVGRIRRESSSEWPVEKISHIFEKSGLNAAHGYPSLTRWNVSRDHQANEIHADKRMQC